MIFMPKLPDDPLTENPNMALLYAGRIVLDPAAGNI
jgi:hypothetical protein